MKATRPRCLKSCAAALLLMGAASANAQTARTADESAFAVTLEKAEQGDADAQFGLGIMYYAGRGVPKDDGESARWIRLAFNKDTVTVSLGSGSFTTRA